MAFINVEWDNYDFINKFPFWSYTSIMCFTHEWTPSIGSEQTTNLIEMIQSFFISEYLTYYFRWILKITSVIA